MRKIIFGLLFILAGAANALGQSTTVSGNVTDASSQAWAGGTYQFQFAPNPQFPTGPYTWTGGALNKVISGTLDGSGNYSVSIPSNTAISPQGSKWILQVTPNATSPSFSTPPTTITGGTQTLNATPPAVTTPPTLFARAYADSEITGATIGSQYFNVTTSMVRVCTVVTGLACTTWANVGSGAGGGVTGSGVANQVAFWTGASAIGGNANLTFAPSTLSFVVSGGANSLNEILAGPTQSNGIVVGGVSTGTAVTALETGSDVLIEGDTGVVLEANTSGGVTLGLAGSNTPLFFQGSTSGTFEVSTTPTASELDFGSNAKVTSAGALTVTGGTTTASEISAGANAIAVAGQSAGNGVIIDALVAGGIIDLFASGTAQLTSSTGNVIIKPASGTGTITLGTNGSITDAGALTVSSCTGCGGLSGLTTNTIPKATSATTIGNSDVTDDGTTVTVGVNFAVTGTTTFSGNTFNLGSSSQTNASLFNIHGGNANTKPGNLQLFNNADTVSATLAATNTAGRLSIASGVQTTDTPANYVLTASSTDTLTNKTFSGQIVSTLATGTAPFSIASTTNVANLNASSLNGATFAAPGAIGGTTASSGLFTSLGATGQGNFSGAGAASTASVNFTGAVFTGGSTTTTFPNVYLNYGTAPTTWVTNGTILGINAPSGFGGMYMDVHQNGGASIFSVGSSGAITSGGLATVAGVSSSASVTTAAASGFVFLGRSKLVSGANGSMQALNNTGGGNIFQSDAFQSTGTKFTASGCSNTTTVGGATAGSFASGTTGACTVTITFGDSMTATNGWACFAADQTTPANLISQKSGGSTTTAVFTGTTVSGDVISFGCMAY
jgi:hypothetical protein